MNAIIVNGRTYTRPEILIGRDATCTVVMDHPSVSRVHARLRQQDGRWTFSDESTNGSFIGENRITQIAIDGPVTIRLGNTHDAPFMEASIPPVTETPVPQTQSSGDLPANTMSSALAPPASAATPELGKRTTIHAASGQTVRLGRDESNEIVLSDLRVSRMHARLERTADGHEIIDESSHNGTFVNGAQITRAPLADLDVITIGSHILRFVGGKLEEYVDRGEAWLECESLAVTTPEGKHILGGVGFSLEPSSLLAVVGPSGAGKSTLLNALTGFRPADEGTVAYGGRDVYATFDDLRSRLGFVPQDDILHTQLSVRKALTYAAALRFPSDVDQEPRRARIDEVLGELGLRERAELPIDKLSGGQRKRTSIGLELLTRPSLMFLDEPTSGLDPGNEAQVMDLLRRLADGGRIVVVVTHSVQSLDVCDRVLYLAPGGTVAYFGPPSEALGYFARFGLRSHAEIFRALDEQRDRDWAGEFAGDIAHERYVGASRTLSTVRRARRGEQPMPARPRQSWFRQFGVLTRRAVSVLRADRKNLILLAAQAPIFGLLNVLLLPTGTMSTRFGVQASMLLWLVVMGVTWLGTGNSIREIARESAIYRRERSVGLSISAYVASKVVVLGAITVVQAAVLTAISFARQTVPPEDSLGVFTILGLPVPDTGSVVGSMMVELFVVFCLAGLAAMAVGLLMSALARTVDRALSVLPLVLIIQVVVSMPLIPQKGVLNGLGYAMTSKWANDAAASTVSLNELRLPYYAATFAGSTIIFGSDQTKRAAMKPFRPEWEHSRKAWATSAGATAGFVLLGVLGTYIVLRRRDANLLGGSFARKRARKQ